MYDFLSNEGICCVLVLLIHQKRALGVTKLVPIIYILKIIYTYIKGVEEQVNVCNHVACWLCLLLTSDDNKALNCNFWKLTLHAYLGPVSIRRFNQL